MGVSFDDLPDVVKPKSVTFDDIPDAYDRSKAGIGERINKAGERRFGQIQGIANQAAQGQIGDAEAMGRIGLKTAVIVPDIAGEVATSAFRALPNFIENPIRSAASNVYTAISNLPSFGGGTIGERIPQEAQAFQQNNPVAAGRIGSVLDAGNLVAPFLKIGGTSVASATGMAGEKALTTGKKALDISGEVATPIVKTVKNSTIKIAPNVSPEVARKAGGQLLERAKQSGAVIPAQKATEFIDNLNVTIKPTSEWAVAAREPTPIDTMLKNFETLRDKPMSLDDAMQLDSQLGAFAHSPQNFVNGKYSAAGVDALKIQKNLSDMIDNADGSIDPSALADWKQGKQQWSASIRANKINNIIDNSQYSDHPATSIRVGMRGIIKNKNEFARYSKQEQKLIRRAAETGIVTDTLRLGASGLGPIVSGAMGGFTGMAFGGPVGAAIGSAVAAAPAMAFREGSKAIATARQTARATDALKSVLTQGAGLPTKKLTMREIMKLPPDQAKYYLNNIKEVK